MNLKDIHTHDPVEDFTLGETTIPIIEAVHPREIEKLIIHPGVDIHSGEGHRPLGCLHIIVEALPNPQIRRERSASPLASASSVEDQIISAGTVLRKIR
jgi:hypothetical protein